MDSIRNGLLGGCFLLLVQAAAPCQADNSLSTFTERCADNCENQQLVDKRWRPGTGYPGNLVPRSEHSNPGAATTRAPETIMNWHPPNTHWLAKLRGMSELRLLTLWESAGTRVFLSVSEQGVPKIALSSRRMPESRGSKRQQDTQDWRRYQDSLIYY